MYVAHAVHTLFIVSAYKKIPAHVVCNIDDMIGDVLH